MGRSGLKIVPVSLQRHAAAASPLDTAKDASARAFSSPMPGPSKTQIAAAVLNWSLCVLLLFLLLSQFLAIALKTSVTSNHLLYGREVSLGLYEISGYNDEPYSDRMLICLQRGRRFEVSSVNEALNDPMTAIEDLNGMSLNGYRVVNRRTMTISPDVRLAYLNTCSRLSATLDYIVSVCSELGYTNVTRDILRIVDDISSTRLYRIPRSLPVLIMPYWDNAPTSRYAIPGADGQACMFRLEGDYEVANAGTSSLVAVNRTVREYKTRFWLGKFDGTWKNGWYEDNQGMRWYSDVVSTNPLNPDGLASRRFDMINRLELDCEKESSLCAPSGIETSWGKLLMTRYSNWYNSITISNGNRYGLFLYESYGYDVVTCIYDVTSFTSDMAFAWLLFQWMLSMIAIQRGYFKRVSVWQDTDIGCIANSYSFEVLIISNLPRLKTNLAAYYSAGCDFEGSQMSLSNAWFVMYPAIVSCVLLQSSVLNIIAKLLRRRMSSWQIPITITLLSLMHLLRASISTSHYFGIDGRISTLVTSDELKAMSLFEMITPTTALKLGGNAKSLFISKMLLLLLNTLPLVFSQDMSLNSKRSKAHIPCVCEQSLSIRACNVGGLGRFGMYELDRSNLRPRLMLNAYEVVRLGYIVVGDEFLMTWKSWIRLVVSTMLSRVFRLKTFRILVFDVVESSNGRISEISTNPQMINLSDARLVSIKWWDIDSRPLL